MHNDIGNHTQGKQYTGDAIGGKKRQINFLQAEADDDGMLINQQTAEHG